MLRKILSLCLTLALSCCLLAPALHADGEDGDAPSAEEVKALLVEAEAGDANARARLGMIYEYGEGVPRDDKEALAWYRKAAEQGDLWGMFKVGRMYEEGRGGLTRDLKEAEAWYARAAERLAEEPVENADDGFKDHDRGAVEEIEGALYRLRGGVVFKRYRLDVKSLGNSLSVVVDYPESGSPKALAALRKEVETIIDESSVASSPKLDKPLKTARGGIQARLDALGKAVRALPKPEDTMDRYAGKLSIDVLHQDKKTVTFRRLDTVAIMGTPPVWHFILGKEDGQSVKRGELFILPGTKPDKRATDGEAGGHGTAADFVAAVLRGNMLGAWSGGLFQSEGRNIYGITGGSSVSWADLAPYLTARGREFFAEHLPEQVKGAWRAEEPCPVLPEFRRQEKTISVQRGKGAKQTAVKVKAVVDWPEGGEPKATNALRKGVDALLAQCAAGQGITKVMLSLRYRDPRLATYECMAWRPKKYDGRVYFDRSTPFSATLSAPDGRRIGFADLAEVAEEEWEQLMNSAETEEDFYGEEPEHPDPAQARVAVFYDRLKITSPKAEDFPGWSLPYKRIDMYLTPEGKALLGR